MNTSTNPLSWTHLDSSLPPLDDPAARTLLAAMHARMYKWPPAFVGYRARLCVNDNGIQHEGSVTVRLGREASVELDGPETLCRWVRERLWRQAMHLSDMPFSEGDGRHGITFASAQEDADNHPRGRQIILRGGSLQACYWIKDTRYTQIERRDPTGALCVNLIERYEMAPDRRLYITHYVKISFSRVGGSQATIESCANDFLWRNGVLFPSRRRVSEVPEHETRTREILLSEHDALA
jgi:hypothetical protein